MRLGMPPVIFREPLRAVEDFCCGSSRPAGGFPHTNRSWTFSVENENADKKSLPFQGRTRESYGQVPAAVRAPRRYRKTPYEHHNRYRQDEHAGEAGYGLSGIVCLDYALSRPGHIPGVE